MNMQQERDKQVFDNGYKAGYAKATSDRTAIDKNVLVKILNEIQEEWHMGFGGIYDDYAIESIKRYLSREGTNT